MSAPRDLATVLWRWGRLSLVFEPRDVWLGVYVGQDAVYVCAVPCLPVRWARKSRCSDRDQMTEEIGK